MEDNLCASCWRPNFKISVAMKARPVGGRLAVLGPRGRAVALPLAGERPPSGRGVPSPPGEKASVKSRACLVNGFRATRMNA